MRLTRESRYRCASDVVKQGSVTELFCRSRQKQSARRVDAGRAVDSAETRRQGSRVSLTVTDYPDAQNVDNCALHRSNVNRLSGPISSTLRHGNEPLVLPRDSAYPRRALGCLDHDTGDRLARYLRGTIRGDNEVIRGAGYSQGLAGRRCVPGTGLGASARPRRNQFRSGLVRPSPGPGPVVGDDYCAR